MPLSNVDLSNSKVGEWALSIEDGWRKIIHVGMTTITLDSNTTYNHDGTLCHENHSHTHPTCFPKNNVPQEYLELFGPAPEEEPVPLATHYITAVYYPKINEIELTWEDIETGKRAALVTKVSPEKGNQIAEVIYPCVNQPAAVKPPSYKFHDGEPVWVRDSDDKPWLPKVFKLYDNDVTHIYPYIVYSHGVDALGYKYCAPWNNGTPPKE